MQKPTWTDYEYQELLPGEIRLLKLDIDDTSDQLTGTLRRWQTEDKDFPQLSSPPNYWALSHHWDPAPQNDEEFQALPILLLHDPEHPNRQLYRLRLRKSLAQALYAVRKRAAKLRREEKMAECHLWVDAICIDQTSDDDKGKQLGRMGYIYNEADTVIVWLGLLDDKLRRGMSFVQELRKLHQLEDFLSNDRYQDDWIGLMMLSRNPWFQRLWIVQEIAAAKDAIMLAEEEEVNWADFESAWSIFVSQFEKVRNMLARTGFFARVTDPFGEVKLSAANVLVNMQSSVLRRSQTGTIAEHLMTLEHLLTNLVMFEVTEPRDVVYAVLWLSSDAGLEAKRTASTRHIHQDRTPDIRHLRTEHAVQSPDPASQTLFVNGVTPSHRARAPSISAQFLEVPARVLEHQQVHESADDIITPDYRQSVFELCKQVLLHIIYRTQRLDIICFRWAPPSSKKDQKHPSWLLSTKRNKYSKKPIVTLTSPPSRVAGTSQRNAASPLIGKPGSNKRPYLACGRTRASDRHVQIDGRILRVIGWKLGRIEEDAGEALKAVIPWKWRCLLGWKRNDEYPPDKVWRILVADKGPNDQPPPIRFRMLCRWAFELGTSTYVDTDDEDDDDTMMDGHDRDIDLEKIRDAAKTPEVLKEFLDCAIDTVWKRKLFKTETCPQSSASSLDSAFFGLGPSTLKQGDIVAVLWGCAVPVILRPYRRAPLNQAGSHPSTVAPAINVSVPLDRPLSIGDTIAGSAQKGRKPKLAIKTEPTVEDYEFVGECYVHGMMNGEIFHWADSHGKRVMDFNLH